MTIWQFWGAIWRPLDPLGAPFGDCLGALLHSWETMKVKEHPLPYFFAILGSQGAAHGHPKGTQ